MTERYENAELEPSLSFVGVDLERIPSGESTFEYQPAAARTIGTEINGWREPTLRLDGELLGREAGDSALVKAEVIRVTAWSLSFPRLSFQFFVLRCRC